MTIIDPIRIPEELLCPTNLSGSQALCIHEPTKIITIGKDKDCIKTFCQLVWLEIYLKTDVVERVQKFRR